MKNLTLLTTILFTSYAYAQLVEQQARTRKISYDAKADIVAIPKVSVKVESSELSDAQGKVLLKISPNAGKTYHFKELRKSGYTPISPSEDDLRDKKAFPLNPHAVTDIILADILELQAEKERIASKRKHNYDTKISELETQIEQERDEAKQQALRDELIKLYDDYEKIIKFIDKEADKLSRIDYMALSAMDLKNTELKKEGKGNELIAYNLSLLPPDHEKQATILAQLIEDGEQKLTKLKEQRDFYAKLYENVAYGHEMKFEHQEAAKWLKLRTELDPENFKYQLDYANYIQEFLDDYENSLLIYKLCAKLAQKDQGNNSSQIIIINNNIAGILRKTGNYDAALEIYLNNLKILNHNPNKYNSYIALIYNNIGGVYYLQNNFDAALKSHLKALTIREKLQGKEHPYTATTYNNIGLTYEAQNELSAAIEYHNLALAVRKKIYGDENLDTASSYNNLGLAYDKLGMSYTALQYHLKALHANELILGTEHTITATCYNNLGGTYTDLRNFTQALAYYQKALAIVKKKLGDTHQYTKTTYFNIAHLYTKQNDYPNAIKVYHILLKSFHNEFSDKADIYFSIANAHKQLGNYNATLKYHLKTLELFEKNLSANHINIAIVYTQIAEVYELQKKLSEARKYYSLALDIFKITTGKNHPNYQSTQQKLNSLP